MGNRAVIEYIDRHRGVGRPRKSKRMTQGDGEFEKSGRAAQRSWGRVGQSQAKGPTNSVFGKRLVGDPGRKDGFEGVGCSVVCRPLEDRQTMGRRDGWRDSNEPNNLIHATQRNATQHNATQRNTTQRNATRMLQR